MRKRFSIILLLVLTAITLAASTTVYAASMATYEFTLTGIEIVSYTVYNGASGSSPVDNDLYSGARLFKTWDNQQWQYTDQYASYQQSSNRDFISWTLGGDKIVDLQLWGYGGRGNNWGERYKVQDWVSASSTDPNWHPYIDSWPSSWGPTPANNNGDLQDWWASDDAEWDYDYNHGFGFYETSYPEFTFSLTLDMDDPAFYGNSSPWYDDREGQMVFWFGAWTMDIDGNFTGFYEGNVILQGELANTVPEPASLLLFGMGLVTVLAGTRCRRK
ncbi:PEP-CTERM sorting domain-containing protein [Desulfomarina profundi]|nr:PEP-CTERM sorting domain-containing protein [Desulfomarina profundi]